LRNTAYIDGTGRYVLEAEYSFERLYRLVDVSIPASIMDVFELKEE
jgi:hypothetical protein